MLALLLCIVATASAAPQYFYRYSPQSYNNYEKYFKDDVFDTARFWTELEDEMKRFNNEMAKLDEFMHDFSKSFVASSSTEALDGNEYKINIVLPGFDEKDIVVKAREGILMIQAVKTENGGQKNYLDLRTLPLYVNVSGNWIYEKDVLKVVFPVDVTAISTTETTIIKSEDNDDNKSREEMETHQVDKDTNTELEIEENKDTSNNDITNEIHNNNALEATTYAVDLKNEVEFVPIRYK